MITHPFVRGYSIMVITLAFQANDVSSILTIRSIFLGDVNGGRSGDCKSLAQKHCGSIP